MRRREFALLVGPSMIVMFGLLLLPLIRTVQWSFQDVQYGAPGRVRRAAELRVGPDRRALRPRRRSSRSS